MASLIEIIILGIIQGITEWLPVSSSGHLVLMQEFFRLEQPLIFDVMLHAGTLIVILVFFRKDIVNILRALVRRDFASDDAKLALYVAVGTVPVAVAGYVFHDAVESLFRNPLVVSVALLFMGCLLFISERRESNRQLSLLDSALIGIAQAVSLIPGISRSGSTISTGLLRGVQKEKAFKFSFLLAIPAISGALIFEAKDAAFQSIDLTSMLLGAAVSMVVGYFALRMLRKIVTGRRLHYFAYYCWALGLIVFILLLFR